MRAEMVEIFAFEPDPGAAAPPGQILAEKYRCGPALILGHVALPLPDELRIVLVTDEGRGDFVQRRFQFLRNKLAAVGAEITGSVNLLCHGKILRKNSDDICCILYTVFIYNGSSKNSAP